MLIGASILLGGWAVRAAWNMAIENPWLFVLLPIVVVATHLTVWREARSLERGFDNDYRDYEDDIRRYF